MFNYENVTNENCKKALSLYFDINARPEVVIFLEQILKDLCEDLEIDPEVDLENPYVDSANYQREVISETIQLILSTTDEVLINLNTKLSPLLAHMEDIEASYAEESEGEDDDDTEEGDDFLEPEDIDGDYDDDSEDIDAD